MSIRLKITVIVLGFFIISGIVFAVYSAATTENYRRLRTAEVSKTVAFESERVGRAFTEMERNVLNIAMLGEQAYSLGREPEELGHFFRVEDLRNFRANYNPMGVGILFEPYALRADTERAFSYVFYDQVTGSISHNPEFGSGDHDYHSQSWYTEIRTRLGGKYSTAWSSPYFGNIGISVLLTTVGAGIYDENERFIGMAIIDWQIQNLVNRLSAIKMAQNCFVLVASLKDDYIISYTHGNGLDLIGESLRALPWLENLHYANIDNDVNVGIGYFADAGVDYIAFSRLLDNGWLFSIQVPRTEIFAEVESRNKRFSIIIVISSLLLLLVTFYLLSRLINRPLLKLTSGVAELGGGDLDKQIEIRSKDEIGMLAGAFNKMTVDLKSSIEQIARERAEKERINAELEVAAGIQASMLPCIFPPYPDRSEFDIHAAIQGAKEVSGDFYDFFLIDSNTLAVVMADVSEKGVPAALFMVIAKTLIKNNAQQGKSPKEVFETVNNLLCENNDSYMFVTAFLAYLDIQSGKLTYVNAGHNQPLIKRSDGIFKMLSVKPGFILAGMADTHYSQHEIVLHKGDELFLYTDGVTEAKNHEGVFFGEELLLETANKYSSLPLNEFTASIRREIDKFAEGTEQADDITMLALRYRAV